MAPAGDTGTAAAIVRHTKVREGSEREYAAWRGRVIAALADQPGWVSVEVHPPDGVQDDWVTVERFGTLANAQAWLDSPVRRELAAGADHLVEAPDTVTLLNEEAPTTDEGVTAVITNRVRPSAEGAYREWLARIQSAQAHFPGYQGVSVQPPIAAVSPDWVSLLRFDTAEHLRAWMDSPECAALTAEVAPLLEVGEYRVARASFSNWLPDTERAADPPVWKVNAIVLLVLYPVVLLTVVFLNPILAPLGVALTVFIGNVIGVAATGFWLVPWAAGKMDRWLSPDPANEPRDTRLGTLYVLLAYAGLIALMTVIATRFA